MTVSRREFLKGLTVLGFSVLGGGALVTESACASKRRWPSGQLERRLAYNIVSTEETIYAEILCYTQRGTIDPQPLQEVINLLHQQGGALPSKFSILLVEEDIPGDPERVGLTDGNRDLIIINLGRLFTSPGDYVPQGYTPAHIANGVFAGEVCNLMFSETKQLPAGIPPNREDIQRFCDAFGVMVAAIRAGRTYPEYRDDLNSKFVYEEEGGGKDKVPSFDSETYRRFQNACQKPFLKFE
jgi:hypothetical protein